MKKYLKIIIPLLVLSLIAFMGYKVVSKINHKKAVAENIKTIPAFSYVSIIDDTVFTNGSLVANKSTLFIYFNSECEFCNHEAEMVEENIAKLKDIQIIFVSFEEKEKIKLFAKQYKLLNHANIHFVCDTKASFATTFDVKSLPTVVIYNRDKELVEKIKGQVKIETILGKLEEGN